MNNILKNKWILIILALAVGIVIGQFIGDSPVLETGEKNQHDHSEVADIWTCSMHPQIQLDSPGQCPICGMDLIPLDNSMEAEETLPNEIPMSEAAMKLAEIQTYIVKSEKPQKEIRLLGKVKSDERLMYSQAIHFPGRIEKLFINFTGEKIRKGQKLATVYSAELVTAQKELFEVLKDELTSPVLVEAARNKLKQWKFTDEQIAALESKGHVQTQVDIFSDYSGYVMTRMVSEGDHFKQGQVLFEITDLSKVWILFEAYENDLPWVNLEDKLEIELKSIPGKKYKGSVAFIDPFINPKTRVAYVRVELDNINGQLKPDMFANGIITSKLATEEEAILVPKSSVLWTGKRAVVYVKLPYRNHNSFIYREVILGEDAGDSYIVKSGLEEGEEIASNGVFKIDASAQLAGKKSMMNPTGKKTATGHNHGADIGETVDMDMSEMNTAINQSKIPAEFKKQMGNVVERYLFLKDKLVNDNSDIQKEVSGMKKALAEVDMFLLLEDAHNAWMDALKSFDRELKNLAATSNITAQRSEFLNLSSSLSDIIQLLGVEMKENQNLYLQYCPMANDNNGGYWLSTENEISNPYFGSEMLECGSTEKQIN